VQSLNATYWSCRHGPAGGRGIVLVHRRACQEIMTNNSTSREALEGLLDSAAVIFSVIRITSLDFSFLLECEPSSGNALICSAFFRSRSPALRLNGAPVPAEPLIDRQPRDGDPRAGFSRSPIWNNNSGVLALPYGHSPTCKSRMRAARFAEALVQRLSSPLAAQTTSHIAQNLAWRIHMHVFTLIDAGQPQFESPGEPQPDRGPFSFALLVRGRGGISCGRVLFCGPGRQSPIGARQRARGSIRLSSPRTRVNASEILIGRNPG